MKSLRTILCAMFVLSGCFDPENVRDPSLDPPRDGAAPDATADGSQQDGHHDAGDPQACTTSQQCTDSTAPRCASNTCSACAETTDCERFADTPACGVEGACVQCTEQEPSGCTGSTPVCLAGGTACVECNADSDCKNAANAKCDTTTHSCVPCEDNTQCGHLDGQNVCNAGGCVQCTPVTEESDCGDNACDPDTFECTSTRRGSLGTCRACRSDSECGADRKCVEVPFMGAAGGYYCMQIEPESAECPLPYRGPALTTASKSGAPSARYCAHNTNVTTCDAVNSLTSDKSCTAETVEADCGRGARCEPRPVVLKCTYDCSGDPECPGFALCNEEGATPNPYCGGP